MRLEPPKVGLRGLTWALFPSFRSVCVQEPKIEQPTDAIAASAIAGLIYHVVSCTMTGMQDGTILKNEGSGVVEVGAALFEARSGWPVPRFAGRERKRVTKRPSARLSACCFTIPTSRM